MALEDEITFDEEEEAIQKEELFPLLAEFIRIGKDTGRVVKREEFDDLNLRQKVLVAFLTQIAREKLDVLDGGETRKLAPSDAAKLISKETAEIYPIIRDLERRELIKRENRQYSIPPEAFDQVREILPS